MVADWTIALVVVDKVLTIARLTCSIRAIILILTSARALWLDLLFKAALTDAFVIFAVLACRSLCIDTLAMCSALADLAVIHV
jgi:hypothetical protein